MIRSVIYRPNGSIAQTSECTADLAALQDSVVPAGCSILHDVPGWVDIETAYVAESQVQKRVDMVLTVFDDTVIADGDDTATISGIPPSVEVTWPDGVVTSGDETIEFAVDLPGSYTFRFTGVEYLDKEVTIEAVAPA